MRVPHENPTPLCARLSLLLAAALLGLVACSRPAGPVLGSGGSGRGGRGGGGGKPRQPRPLPAFQAPGGLTGVVAGANSAWVRWRLAGKGIEYALFVATDKAKVYAAPPRSVVGAGGVTEVSGLMTGVDYWFGLGARVRSASAYQPVGVVLHARTSPVIYVDAASQSSAPDGKTPATAFAKIELGLATAGFAGGGNVWVRAGNYTLDSVGIPDGTALAGGFDAGFVPLARSPQKHPTVLLGTGIAMLQVNLASVSIDGVHFDGKQQAVTGIDIVDSSVELRELLVENFAGRSARLRNLGGPTLDVVVASCDFRHNGGEGLLGNGAFDIRVDATTFAFNAQEGMDLCDLIAPEGGSASVVVVGSRFVGNGAEGLDYDLVAPFVHGNGHGFLRVVVRGSEFVDNATGGLLVDQDHELDPGWYASISISESTARGNGGDGFHVDADAAGDVVLHGLLSTANVGDGIEISSEPFPGVVLISASVVSANLGAGLRSSAGNKVVLASHCVLAGNGQGFVSVPVRAAASSCIAYLQPSPWTSVDVVASVVVDSVATPTFLHAPRAYGQAVSMVGNRVTLANVQARATDRVEVDADGVVRLVSNIVGAEVSLAPALAARRLPASVAVFAEGSVDEDYRLATGSAASGRGLRPPSDPAVDAGVWGSPDAFEPGLPKLLSSATLRTFKVDPPLHLPIGANQPVVVTMSANIDPQSLATDRVRVVDQSGQVVAASVSVSQAVLTIAPPAGGWGAGSFRIELHRGLRAVGGAPLVTSHILRFTRP